MSENTPPETPEPAKPSPWDRFCHENGEKDSKVIEAFRTERRMTPPETFSKITDEALQAVREKVEEELKGLRVRAFYFSDEFITMAKSFKTSENNRTFLRPFIRLDRGDYLRLEWSRLSAKSAVFDDGMTYDPNERRTRSYRMKLADGSVKRITVAYDYIRKNNVSGGYPKTLFSKEKADWARMTGWQTEENFQLLRQENMLWRDILRKLDSIKRLQDKGMQAFKAQQADAENDF